MKAVCILESFTLGENFVDEKVSFLSGFRVEAKLIPNSAGNEYRGPSDSNL